jgi:transglutaminase-like putative cysteine protease
MFDVWDGRRWTRSTRQGSVVRTESGRALVVPEEDALPAGGERWRQTFRMEAEYAEMVFGAPTVIEVETDRTLYQRPDGTLVSRIPFGRGAVYTVTSVRAPATAERLRASDGEPVPPAILARYAAPTAITDRVARVAQAVTADATTTYDKVRALERWLADHVEYSIDAPLSPAGVDVVDHFVFESRLGWCQQVSTALAVMLRDQGIPARVATGFVPGEYDSLSGEYVVRERHAHQWVEVYFPGVGWQGFDPTASVPLAGEATSRTTPTRWLADHALELLVGVVILAALGAFVFGLVLLARRRRRERLLGPLARRAQRFVQVGRAVERPPADHETVREYGAGVGSKLDADLSSRARRVAELLDRGEFGASALTPEEERELDHELAALEERVEAGV